MTSYVPTAKIYVNPNIEQGKPHLPENIGKQALIYLNPKDYDLLKTLIKEVIVKRKNIEKIESLKEDHTDLYLVIIENLVEMVKKPRRSIDELLEETERDDLVQAELILKEVKHATI